MISSTISGHAFNVGEDWRYPNGIEAHLLDVVQMVNDASPRAATVVARSCITWDSGSNSIVLVGKRKPIRNDLQEKSGLRGTVDSGLSWYMDRVRQSSAVAASDVRQNERETSAKK